MKALQPLLGYVFILEDCPRTRKPLRNSGPHLQADPVFKGASYAHRYEWLLRRLRLEKLYGSACLTLTTNEIPTRITHPANDLTFLQFAAMVEGHIRTFLLAKKER